MSFHPSHDVLVPAQQTSTQDALRYALHLGRTLNDPVGAEPFFRAAMSSRDVAFATQACLEAIKMFVGVGDYAAMRSYAVEGGFRDIDGADAARLQEAQRTAEAMLHDRGQTPLMQGQRPTL